MEDKEERTIATNNRIARLDALQKSRKEAVQKANQEHKKEMEALIKGEA